MTPENQNRKILSPVKIAIAVLALHGCVVLVLANLEARKIELPEIKETPPIEIELIHPIEEEPPELVETKEIKPEPQRERIEIEQSKQERQPEPMRKALQKTYPKQDAKTDSIPPSKPSYNQPPKPSLNPSPKPVIVTEDSVEQQRQWEIEQQRLQKLAQDKASAQATSDAEAKARAEADAKSTADAAVIAKANLITKRAEAKTEADSNTPQKFAYSDAKWIISPKPSLPSYVANRLKSGRYTVLIKIIVDRQGKIISANIKSSSSVIEIDRNALKAVNQAKLSPFTKGGVPVVGTINLPINYDVK